MLGGPKTGAFTAEVQGALHRHSGPWSGPRTKGLIGPGTEATRDGNIQSFWEAGRERASQRAHEEGLCSLEVVT